MQISPDLPLNETLQFQIKRGVDASRQARLVVEQRINEMRSMLRKSKLRSPTNNDRQLQLTTVRIVCPVPRQPCSAKSRASAEQTAVDSVTSRTRDRMLRNDGQCHGLTERDILGCFRKINPCSCADTLNVPAEGDE